MATKLIELEDGTLVEVQAPPDQAQQIAGGFADKVGTSFKQVLPIVVKVCKPITAAWRELSQDMDVEKAEIELGLAFEGEGNVYVTKATAGANLTVKLILKPRE